MLKVIEQKLNGKEIVIAPEAREQARSSTASQ